MKFGGLAFDLGPSQVLEKIGAVLSTWGHNFFLPPPQKDISAEDAEKLSVCDMIVTGLSALNPMRELRVLEILKAPVIIIEDVPRASMVPGAKAFASRVRAVIAAHGDLVGEIEAFGYKNVIYVGPPPHWGDLYKKIISLSKADARKKFTKVLAGSVEKLGSEQIVFISGIKDLVINNTMIQPTVRFGKDGVLGFKGHPAEITEYKTSGRLDAYKGGIKEREAALSGVWTLEGDNPPLYQWIAAADQTIFTGAPNEGIVAAYARLACHYYFDSNVEAYLKKAGRYPWFPVERGGNHLINGPEEIPAAIRFLATKEGRTELRSKQEKAFPLPVTWNTAPIFAGAIEALI